MKHTRLNTILVLVIMFIVFYIIMKDDYANIIKTLYEANQLLIILGIVCIFTYYLFKARALYLIAREQKKDITFRKMFNQTLITQFFNGITPFSTGGQPMQIYMLNKSGLTISKSTSIIIQDFLMYQLALVTIGIVALILNRIFRFINIDMAVYILILFGFAINIAVGLCLLFISFSKRFNNFIGKLIIKIGSKLKLIKNVEETIKTWEIKLDEFHESAKIFKKKKDLFIKCYLYNMFALIAFYLIPFLVFVSFDVNCGITLMAAFTSSAFILLVGNFVPLPGGSGGIEASFGIIFKGLIKDSLVSPALIVWRTITYYLGVLVGGILLGFFKGSEKK